ncbi:hypothetical protein BC936DRAFT_146025 [Jimgerdemannia flammicorona]|uniref:Uncharacterized protein n=1 Tax=Jimgerdemannia flammicorona TaxID=994334 RepID=A0A433D8J9_9FUNG|nr:hypothetical protein BC936DRAFT_146025 [Jimgerdemannia flammicorona]
MPASPYRESEFRVAGSFVPILMPMSLPILDDFKARRQWNGDAIEGILPATLRHHYSMEGVEFVMIQ